VWGALALCTALLIIATYVPLIASVLAIQPPTAAGWGIIALMSLIPLVVGQFVLTLRARFAAPSS
jgi:Ca2+-transporting ATPase